MMGKIRVIIDSLKTGFLKGVIMADEER